MKRIVVFRFHKLPAICRERVLLLKKINPSTSIFGLFGGEREDLSVMKEAIGPFVEDIFCLNDHSPSWKWRFGDLALREWFGAVGIAVPFDFAHIIEWDLLLCKPLGILYSHVSSDSIGLTAVRRVEDVASTYPFTAEEPLSLEWKKLLTWAKTAHSHVGDPLVCLGPGYCVPRGFLEAYAKFDMPEISVDELRLPMAAQLLGIRIVDTRLCRAWYMNEEIQIFNTYKKEILVTTVLQELRKVEGRRAFHPFVRSLAEVQGALGAATVEFLGRGGKSLSIGETVA